MRLEGDLTYGKAHDMWMDRKSGMTYKRLDYNKKLFKKPKYFSITANDVEVARVHPNNDIELLAENPDETVMSCYREITGCLIYAQKTKQRKQRVRMHVYGRGGWNSAHYELPYAVGARINREQIKNPEICVEYIRKLDESKRPVVLERIKALRHVMKVVSRLDVGYDPKKHYEYPKVDFASNTEQQAASEMVLAALSHNWEARYYWEHTEYRPDILKSAINNAIKWYSQRAYEEIGAYYWEEVPNEYMQHKKAA